MLLQILFLTLLSSIGFAAKIRITTCSAPQSWRLQFPEAPQGDLLYTVLPDTTDNTSNACYRITGDANAFYNVTLPTSVNLQKSGGANIAVTGFVAATQTGTFNLGGTGSQFVYVGATRITLPINQTPGTYQNTFSVSARYSSGGVADSVQNQVNMQVIRVLLLYNSSSLNFGEAVPTDPALTVPPGTSENTMNGSFSVNGEPNHTYQIILPTSAVMSTGIGGPNREIPISQFLSYPSAGQATLPSTGTQTIYVGATRAAIPATQIPGTYQGTYTLQVIY